MTVDREQKAEDGWQRAWGKGHGAWDAGCKVKVKRRAAEGTEHRAGEIRHRALGIVRGQHKFGSLNSIKKCRTHDRSLRAKRVEWGQKEFEM